MKTSINFQPPFSYNSNLLIIVIMLILILTIYCLYKNYQKQKKQTKIVIKQINSNTVELIKKKYLKEIDYLLENINKEEITTRKAYQETSKIIRLFVFEVTSVKVQNYTLSDIEKINMPILFELVKEYYTPEFSLDSYSDIKKSLQNTKEVIEKWK